MGPSGGLKPAPIPRAFPSGAPRTPPWHRAVRPRGSAVLRQLLPREHVGVAKSRCCGLGWHRGGWHGRAAAPAPVRVAQGWQWDPAPSWGTGWVPICPPASPQHGKPRARWHCPMLLGAGAGRDAGRCGGAFGRGGEKSFAEIFKTRNGERWGETARGSSFLVAGCWTTQVLMGLGSILGVPWGMRVPHAELAELGPRAAGGTGRAGSGSPHPFCAAGAPGCPHGPPTLPRRPSRGPGCQLRGGKGLPLLEDNTPGGF